MICPGCLSDTAGRSRRRMLERILQLVRLEPYRCGRCGKRFYRFQRADTVVRDPLDSDSKVRGAS